MELTTKDQLKRQLKKIEEKEFKDLVQKEFPRIKSKEGKFFKIKNSYGPNKNWWRYAQIKRIRKSDLYLTSNGICGQCKAFIFEVDCYGRIFISTENSYVHSHGKEISKEEFYEAYRIMMNSIKSML